MKRVEQTRSGDGLGSGNCVAACLASIFELSLPEVERDLPDGPSLTQLSEWTRQRFPWLECRTVNYGENYREVEPPSDDEPDGRWTYDLPAERPAAPTKGFWMASIVSPRGKLRSGPYRGGPMLHCMVMRGEQLAWDPSPQRDEGRGAPLVMCTWWIALDPARAAHSGPEGKR